MALHDDPQPIKRNRFIHETVRDAIEAGALAPGLVLTESALARFFDVSRAPAADALARLEEDRLITRHEGRGYLVGDGTDTPLRVDLAEAGLRLPGDAPERLAARSARETLYPIVEIEVASAAGYGSYLVGSAAMAEHFAVSRTTSQDILSRLERVGLVEQAANGRWRIPRLTTDAVVDHYEMRRLLEPVALVQRRPTPSLVAVALDRIATLRQGEVAFDATKIADVENDLHVRLVLDCPNPRMRDAIRRSQLPLIATHAAFDRYRRAEEMARVLEDHSAILKALRREDLPAAAELMVQHLRHGEATTLNYVAARPDPPAGIVKPYMSRIED